MPKSPEQFDFSKVENQQKFEEQPEEKRKECIEKSHEEAAKTEEDIQKIEKMELSPEETSIARDSVVKGKNLGEAISSAQIEKGLDDIEKEFITKKREEVTEDDLKELKEKIAKMIGFFSEEAIHFDIRISPAEQFFRFATRNIHRNLFTDKKTFDLVAKNVTDVFLDAESKRKFAFEDLINGKMVYKPNNTHIAQKKREAAHFLESLDLFEDAYDLYSTSAYGVYGGGVDKAGGEIINLLENYVKSGQKSTKMDRVIESKIKTMPDIKFDNGLQGEERDIFGGRTKEKRIELFNIIKEIKPTIEKLKKLGLPESKLKEMSKEICIKGANELFKRATDKYVTGEYKGVDAYEVYHGSLNITDNLQRYVDGIIEISRITGDKNFIEKAYKVDLDKIFDGIVASHKNDKYFYDSRKDSIKKSIEEYKKILEEKMKEK
ncbi:MAG: hypothetical protein ACD_7C00127G0001 [uncultured bacterium]|nr:MAG: hypothetical protein ACD_7C00127G0001 [uncultured bacterium]